MSSDCETSSRCNSLVSHCRLHSAMRCTMQHVAPAGGFAQQPCPPIWKHMAQRCAPPKAIPYKNTICVQLRTCSRGIEQGAAAAMRRRALCLQPQHASHTVLHRARICTCQRMAAPVLQNSTLLHGPATPQYTPGTAAHCTPHAHATQPCPPAPAQTGLGTCPPPPLAKLLQELSSCRRYTCPDASQTSAHKHMYADLQTS
eukprot:jgi/Ulvmu1/12115/UM084_0041.1